MRITSGRAGRGRLGIGIAVLLLLGAVVVPVGLWRPDDLSDPGAEIKTAIGGVARKPAELRL